MILVSPNSFLPGAKIKDKVDGIRSGNASQSLPFRDAVQNCLFHRSKRAEFKPKVSKD